MKNFTEHPQFVPKIPEIKTEIKQEKIERIDNDDQKYKKYWENYANGNLMAQIDIDNTIALNGDAAYLYETDEDEQEKRLNHIIWVRNNPDRALRYNAIDKQEWKNLTQNPETIKQTNDVLMESYNRVLDFYNWQYKSRGFIIEDNESFGMEVGNFAGIRISYGEITPLIKAIEKRDAEEVKKQQKHIAASLAHELTHRERDGMLSTIKTEIASHITQFIFDPKNNGIFNKQLKHSLDRITENRNDQTKQEQKPLNLYDKAQYIALLIVADELSQHNETYQDILQNDKDPNKLEALKKIQETISVEDEKYLKVDVLQKIMQTDDDQLIGVLEKIEDKLGIKKSIMEIE